MTSTNIDPAKQIVSNFQSLDIDDRLVGLAGIYPQITDTITGNPIDTLPIEKAAERVVQIQQISPEEQLFALRDLLPTQKTDQDEVMLDPNSIEAAVELAQGGNSY
ncbi:orange carotenoid protein N-terminal domain-containing protein [Dendronalium phyllosphericum]|uniref:orange carotenoid protein N-terminal domain-containing protein n=1 Tax=Dendronalium phyllosphericum TaxID=2840445 RepID=UPI0021F0B7C7|nr:orange carotenoid protein N-terminal domain-containing protein [Dendronalium phyllosphericum]